MGPENGEALGTSYRFEERIGSGAVGEVWRIRNVRDGRVLAAKLLRREHAEDPELIERFVRERSLLVRLRHPNIVVVRDLVIEGDRIAIVMDHVAGGSLRGWLRNGPVCPEIALEAVASVLDALEAAHNLGVVHRDIKPDNVLVAERITSPVPQRPELDPDDPGTYSIYADPASAGTETDSAAPQPGGIAEGIRVTDFGIARVIEEGRRSSAGIVGTPEYLSPELVTNGVADQASDVYASGILLYELLCGRTPFDGPGTDYAIAHRHVTAAPPRIEVPDPLWELLSRVLAKDPLARPAAGAAARMLRELAPVVAGVAALPAAESPAGYEEAARPATVVRGIQPGTVGDDAQPGPEEPGSARELGTRDHATVVREMRPLPEPPRSPAEEEAEPKPRRFSRRMVIAAAAAVLVLIAAVIAAIAWPRNGSPPQSDAVAIAAQQQDPPLPSGLTISRSASHDVARGMLELTISYAAQAVPLTGPFLEVLPGAQPDTECPAAQWRGADVKRNQPSRTGIDVPCAWSVEDLVVPAQSSVQVTVSVPIALTDQASLDEWLRTASAATSEAISNPDVAGSAYPVQRIQDIRVVTPSRTVSGMTLQISLVPVWPGGEDPVNPLYVSPAVGSPSSMLEAIAGGEAGVRFSDACSGALAVSSDGLLVTTLSVAPSCQLRAQVGNFTDLESSTFSITTR